MSKKTSQSATRSQRVLITLPKALTVELERHARAFRNGNKSGFVADAIRAYIATIRKRRHTELMRESYAAAAAQSRLINQEWEPLDNEAWEKLDQLAGQSKGRR